MQQVLNVNHISGWLFLQQFVYVGLCLALSFTAEAKMPPRDTNQGRSVWKGCNSILCFSRISLGENYIIENQRNADSFAAFNLKKALKSSARLLSEKYTIGKQSNIRGNAYVACLFLFLAINYRFCPKSKAVNGRETKTLSQLAKPFFHPYDQYC